MDFLEVLGVLATPLSMVMVVVTFVITQRRNNAGDTKAATKELTEIAFNVNYIKDCIEEMRSAISNHGAEINQLRADIIKLQCANDTLENKVKTIESKINQ